MTAAPATLQQQLEGLLQERSIRRGDFVLASGQRSSYYIDCRLTTMSAQGQVVIGALGLEAIRARGWAPDAIGGLTMGADPVAYAVAAASANESMHAGTRRAFMGDMGQLVCRRSPRGTGRSEGVVLGLACLIAFAAVTVELHAFLGSGGSRS